MEKMINSNQISLLKNIIEENFLDKLFNFNLNFSNRKQISVSNPPILTSDELFDIFRVEFENLPKADFLNNEKLPQNLSKLVFFLKEIIDNTKIDNFKNGLLIENILSAILSIFSKNIFDKLKGKSQTELMLKEELRKEKEKYEHKISRFELQNSCLQESFNYTSDLLKKAEIDREKSKNLILGYKEFFMNFFGKVKNMETALIEFQILEHQLKIINTKLENGYDANNFELLRTTGLESEKSVEKISVIFEILQNALNQNKLDL